MKSPITRNSITAAWVVIALLTFVFAFSACKAEVNVAIDEEDSGEIELIGAVNDAILSLMRMSGDDPLEDLLDFESEQLSGEGLQGASIEPYSQGGYTGIRIRANFDPYDPTIAAFSNDDSTLGNLTETVGLGEFKFERTADDDGWIVRLEQTTDGDVVESFDDIVGDIPFGGFSDLDLPFIFSLTLPGKYIEHNANREVENTLIWDANLLEGVDIYAQSQDPGFQIDVVPLLITIFFVLLLAGIAIGVITSRQRRRKRAEEDAEESVGATQPASLGE